ncbi:uridine diphosphate-N-acetylglucosamine-binding protein YvcK [Patescibacteria group bacterium]
MKKKKVVVIGGGTGTIPVLMGLKNDNNIKISVVVSMTDDGGSNRVVRDEFGMLPLSDLRKSIIALANKGNGMFRKLFTYRFDKGRGFSGHTLGNIIMMALSDITGSEIGAIDASCKLFDVTGDVIPVTLDDARLVAEYEDGTKVCGEGHIDEPDCERNMRIKKFYLKPRAEANPQAVKSIKSADFIVVGPGDLYTSTLANVVVDGIQNAFIKNKGKFIFITNLMTKNGQTRGMKTTDMIEEISKYTRRKPDYVLINNVSIPNDIIRKYKRLENEVPVKDNTKGVKDIIVIRKNLIGTYEVKREKGDMLLRSLIRHDEKKLGNVLKRIIKN